MILNLNAFMIKQKPFNLTNSGGNTYEAAADVFKGYGNMDEGNE